GARPASPAFEDRDFSSETKRATQVSPPTTNVRGQGSRQSRFAFPSCTPFRPGSRTHAQDLILSVQDRPEVAKRMRQRQCRLRQRRGIARRAPQRKLHYLSRRGRAAWFDDQVRSRNGIRAAGAEEEQ